MRLNALLIAILFLNNTLFAHTEEKSQASIIRYDVKGCIVDKMNNTPIEFATVFLPERNLWSISNEKGEFIIHQVPEGKCKVHVSLIGYQSQEFEMIVSKETPKLKIFLQENNLLLDEVVVTAQANKSSLTTSYNLDRTTLDHAQIKTVGTIGSLLPGGKTSRDGNLSVSNPRIALRAGSNEMGNASFGTAVAIDGVRLENNATMDETKGVGLRNVSISNIESVEIISGIPSVEYGDLSNGFVKIQTKKGRTPFMIEFSTEPKTKLIALSKGFFLGHKSGTLNASFERAKSTSNLASPYTAYDRNAVSFLYANTLNKNGKRPLSITANINGNLGGYDSKADPDAFANNYKKNKDYSFRGNIDLNYQLNQPWITSLSLNASASYADKLVEESTGKNSSSTQPLIHALDEGYYIATNYDINPNAPIILGPTGYWNEIKYVDSKPINYAIKIKANWAKSFGVVRNKLLVGLDYTSSGNGGQGVFYDDMRYAPTWRRYRYYELPFLNNCAAYVENGVTIPTNNKGGQLKVTAGLRSEMTLIKESVYGTTNSVSPRFNSKYTLWSNQEDYWLNSISVYGGWGKSVKLPSFEVLYPSPSYADKLAFAPGTMNDGTTFYAYYSIPSKAVYNPDLKWQYANQTELGIEANVKGTKVNISTYRNITYNPYMLTNVYTPYTYKQTSQSHLESCIIPSSNREYSIDKETGIVTVADKTGVLPNQQLGYKERDTFKSNRKYVNGSPVERMGLEWIVDFAKLNPLNTTIRLDGRYYYYKSLDETLIASMPSSASTMADGNPYKYVGYYIGASGGSTSYVSSTSVANGSISKELNTNLILTSHIPKIRMILSVRLESSLYNYRQSLCEYSDGGYRGMALENGGDYSGVYGDVYGKDKYVAVYPKYYSTWDDPDVKIPFAEKLSWAKENDAVLYNELTKLVMKTNTSYYFNPNRISSYFSANFSLTKEIGDYASVSFFANNFFNHVGIVKSSQAGLETSLYASAYIPKFYYGLTLKLKI